MQKEITFTVVKELLEKAKARTARENTSLDTSFRKWLTEDAQTEHSTPNYDQLLKSMAYMKPGKIFDRDERNERLFFHRHQHFHILV